MSAFELRSSFLLLLLSLFFMYCLVPFAPEKVIHTFKLCSKDTLAVVFCFKIVRNVEDYAALRRSVFFVAAMHWQRRPARYVRLVTFLHASMDGKCIKHTHLLNEKSMLCCC